MQSNQTQTRIAYEEGYQAGLKMRPNYARKAVDGDYSQGYSDGVTIYYQQFEERSKPKLPEIPGERYAAGMAAAERGDRPYWIDPEYLAGWVAGVALKPDGSVKYGSGYLESCPSDRTRQEWHG